MEQQVGRLRNGITEGEGMVTKSTSAFVFRVEAFPIATMMQIRGASGRPIRNISFVR